MPDTADLKVEPGASLRTLAVARIRSEISEGRMAPGSRLVERDLCAALGVSRTVIREAIRQLEAEGYVAQVPRRGPIVAPLDLATIRSIYEVREVLEAKAAALFVERATPPEKARIAELNRQIQGFAHGGDHAEGLAILAEFHRVILEGSGNTLFAAILAPLSGRIHMLQVRAVLAPDRRAAAARLIALLAEALCGDDPEAAAAAARRCIVDGCAFATAAYCAHFPDA